MFYQKEAMIFVGLGFAIGATTWYIFWVKPHNEMRLQVIDCMGGDLSESSYMMCMKELSP